MRETVKNYETKVETVENEQEIVYCDICTAQCTETHDVVPMELCPDCQPDEEEQEWTLKTYKEAYEDADIENGSGESWLFIGLFPIFFLAAIADGADGHEYAKYLLTPVIGLLLWIGIGYGLYLLASLL